MCKLTPDQSNSSPKDEENRYFVPIVAISDAEFEDVGVSGE